MLKEVLNSFSSFLFSMYFLRLQLSIAVNLSESYTSEVATPRKETKIQTNTCNPCSAVVLFADKCNKVHHKTTKCTWCWPIKMSAIVHMLLWFEKYEFEWNLAFVNKTFNLVFNLIWFKTFKHICWIVWPESFKINDFEFSQ